MPLLVFVFHDGSSCVYLNHLVLEFVSIILFRPHSQLFSWRVDLASRGAFVVFVFVALLFLSYLDATHDFYFILMVLRLYILNNYGVVLLVARVSSRKTRDN